MAGAIRRQVLDRVFGTGVSGLAGAAMLNWVIDQLREGNAPELLDTSKLVPGETYTITTRPAPSRRERRLERKVGQAQRKLDRVAPTRRKVRAAQRRGEDIIPSAKQLKRQAVLDAHAAELASRRAASLAAAQKKARRPVRREFR